MAIANQPRVLIADEPTTALDVTIQAQVLEILDVARRETGAGTVLITHDLGVVAELADQVAVMYAGRMVEMGSVQQVFATPSHPYTLGLLGSLPRLDVEVERLVDIPGQPPQRLAELTGCAFSPRCSLRQGRLPCVADRPRLLPIAAGGQRAACHYTEEMVGERARVLGGLGAHEPAAHEPAAHQPAPELIDAVDGAPLLAVEDLVVRFPVRNGVLRTVGGHVHAVDGVTFALRASERVG